MQRLYKIIMPVLFLFIGPLSAQTGINYSITSDQIIIFGQNISMASTIEKTDTTLNWVQNTDDNSNTISYTIDDTSGTWDKATSQGTLTQLLSKTGFTASFKLVGTNDGISATLTVKQEDSEAIEYTFNVSNITYP